MIYKTNVSKEDFKRAYNSCLKEAWILHSKKNFEKAQKFYFDHKYQFNIDVDIENEDLNSDASAINLFEAFKQVFEFENDTQALEQWNKAWEADDGFSFEVYAGDSIVDGNEVGEKARELFDLKNFKSNMLLNEKIQTKNFNSYTFDEAEKETKKLFDNKDVAKNYRYVYEPAFQYDNKNLKIRCDILEILHQNEVNIYEVKGTSSVKPEHFFDLAYQVFVLQKNGFKVNRVFLVHLNKNYVYGFDEEFSLKDEAKIIEEKFRDLTYQEVCDYIKDKNLLQPFENIPQDDVDLERLFVLDDQWKAAKKNTPKITFKEAISDLNANHSINLMITNLAKKMDMFADNLVDGLFKNDFCQTRMTYNAKNGWIYGQLHDYQESYCYHVMPWYDASEDTIFNLTGSSSFSNRDKAELIRRSGIIYLKDLVNTNLSSLPTKATSKGEKEFLRPEHRRILDVYRNYLKNNKQVNYSNIVDTDHIGQVRYLLKEYKDAKNIYMYDFETVKFAVPRFWFSNTYQQIPFQYSVDVIYDDNYDYNDLSTMRHGDFLPRNDRNDPRPAFLINFLKDMLLKYGEGVYVAYNKSFERTVLKYLAVEFPRFAPPLIYIAAHTIDLMDFFKGKKDSDKEPGHEWFLIYHPKFHGSYSIKKTQPALEPEFNYNDLVINKGDKAAQTFRQFVVGDITDAQWNVIYPAMVKYCNRDTLAMVVILKQVEKMLDEYEKEKQNE